MDAKLQKNLKQHYARLMSLHTQCVFINTKMQKALKTGDMALFEALEKDYNVVINVFREAFEDHPRAVYEILEDKATFVSTVIKNATDKKIKVDWFSVNWRKCEVNLYAYKEGSPEMVESEEIVISFSALEQWLRENQYLHYKTKMQKNSGCIYKVDCSFTIEEFLNPVNHNYKLNDVFEEFINS